MIRIRLRHFSALVLVAWAWLFNPQPSQSQDAPRLFRESVAVAVDAQIVRLLETARDHLVERQWEEAIPILQELIETRAGSLVAVETGRYWNTRDYCHLLLSQMSDEGLAAWRSRTDAQARQWFEEGQRHLDPDPLKRLVDEAFCSSFGDDALWLLGELAFEEGRFAAARQYWSLLVPPVQRDRPQDDNEEKPDLPALYLVFPDASFPEEEVRARLILCSIFEGNRSRASAELAVFREIHPEAEGTLNGQRGRLDELLSSQIEASRGWEVARPSLGSHQTFSGSLARNGRPAVEHEVGFAAWQVELKPNRFEIPSLRPAILNRDPLSYFPVVDRETVYYCDADRIRAVSLRTGTPAPGTEEDGTVFSNIAVSPRTPGMSLAGVPRYTMTISDGVLYARMGPPVSRRSLHEGNTFSEIVGLDIASREGAVVFHVTSDALDTEASSPEATAWSFEGTPVVAGSRVFVSARRGSPEDETLVACFDSETGRVLWKQRICASLRNTPDHYNLIDHRLLTLGDGRLFIATGYGAIAALDEESGHIQWIVTYESADEETPQEQSDERRHGLVPCVYDRGVVYAAPADSDRVFAFDAPTGHLVWELPFQDRIRHLLGVVDGRLVVAGQGLHGIDTRTGTVIWSHRFKDALLQTYGRGVVTPHHVYWPLQESIWKVDLETGQPAARYELKASSGDTGGNLVIAGGMLLIAGPNRIVALAENSRALESRDGASSNSNSREPQPSPPPFDEQCLLELRKALAKELDTPRVALNHFRSILEWDGSESAQETRVRNSILSPAVRGFVRIASRQAAGEQALSEDRLADLARAARLTMNYRDWFSDSERFATVDLFARSSTRSRDQLEAIAILTCLLAEGSRFRKPYLDPARPTSRPTATMDSLIRHRLRQLEGPAENARESDAQNTSSVSAPEKQTLPLWPVRRDWSKILPSTGWLLSDHDAGFVLLLTDDRRLQFVDTGTGRIAWSTTVSDNWDQVVATADVLTLVSRQRMEARRRIDGRLLWHQSFADSVVLPVQHDAHRQTLLRVTDARLSRIAARSGRIDWQFPANHQHVLTAAAATHGQSRFLNEGGASAWLQLRNWNGLAQVDLDNGLPLARQKARAVMSDRPMFLTDSRGNPQRVVGITDQNQLVMRDLTGPRTGDPEFRTLALGQHDPVILSAGADRVVLVEDAQFAECIAADGSRVWRVLLGSSPLPEPSRMTIVADRGFLCVSNGTLRRFSIDNGLLDWELALGDRPWRMQYVSKEVVCLLASTASEDDSDLSASEFVVCHTADGRLIQRLSFEESLSLDQISVRSDCCLVRSNERLTRFAAWNDSATP